MKLTVGVLGRASGIRGEVRVSVQTDDPARRFAPGAVLETDSPDYPLLTVKGAHRSGRHFVASFREITDRNQAETLAGTQLLIDTAPADLDRDGETRGEDLDTGFDAGYGDEVQTAGEDGFYRHELVGLEAQLPDGTKLGTVSDLLLGAAQDLLEVETAGGKKVLVPFVYEIVPSVDIEEGRVVMTPPPGLFNPEQTEESR